MDPAAALNLQMSSRMCAVRETEARGDSEIQQLYAGSIVFITGGTGFLGKQLIEKLLRACHGIRKIYLLTRSKKGKTLEERLAKIYKDPVFNQLRKINPEFEKLIVPVEGDITELKLGIRHDDWEKLTQEVNFIYHVAATVLFNEPMKSAIITNVRGTRELIALARDCRNLKSVVHVSTAYSHCHREEVAEKFYPSPLPPAIMIEMVESMDESRLDAMTPALIEGWPNTYTFSKAIAEEAVRVMGEGLPICVVRPAIVVPSHREPEPGWLDMSNVLGPSGILLGIFIGAVRIMMADVDRCLDFVPVDYVNNLIIASSWETARRYQRGDQDIKVYTSSRIRNRITFAFGKGTVFQAFTKDLLCHHMNPDGLEVFLSVECEVHSPHPGTPAFHRRLLCPNAMGAQLKEAASNDCRNYASPRTIGYPQSILTTNKYVFLLLSTILHFIPALFVDALLMATGQKFRVSPIYQKVYKLNTIHGYFALKTWDFYDDNTLDLSNKLSEADKLIFHFDVADIEHVPFVLIWYLGLRKYIIKDELKGTEKTVKRERIMRIVHYIVSTLYFLFLWKVLSWTFTAALFCVRCILQFVR